MKKKYHKAAALADLAKRPLRKVEVAGRDIVVARVGDTYFAFDQKCTHHGGPLEKGQLSGHAVTCPWHGGVFDIRTGELSHPPPVEHLARYPVRIVDGTIEIEIAEVDAG